MSPARPLVVAALAALACSSTGESSECAGRTSAAIVNGTAQESYLGLGAEDTRAIVRLYDGSGFTVGSCTGTLIRRDWLITARHCLEIERLAIELRTDGESRTLEPRSIEAHPELDVGLIRIEPPLTEGARVRPFALEATSSSEPWLGERVELVGFGIAEEGLLPDGPRYAVETIAEVRDTTLAVDGLGRSGGCLGDSGGPLLVRNESGRPAVLGILSTGSATCLHRDTYVRIDRVTEWVNAIAGEQDSEPIACGAVTELGVCSRGSALVCRGGVLEAQRCEGETVCGWDRARRGFGCVAAVDDPCAGVGSSGECEAGIARECRDGILSARDCGPCDRCGYDPATGVPQCYSR